MAHMLKAGRRLSLFRAPALLIICLFWAPALSGCAGQSQKVSGSGAKSGDALAQAVINSGPGDINISDSPYGRGWASVSEPYLSALGLPCRSVIFFSENQERYDLAVCAESNGVWSTAPNIFAAKPHMGVLAPSAKLSSSQGAAIEYSAEGHYDQTLSSNNLLQAPPTTL